MARWSRTAAWHARREERQLLQRALRVEVKFVLSLALKPGQAARHCSVSVTFLADLRRLDDGPAYWWMGHSIYYMPADLRVWLASCRVVPYQPSTRATQAKGGNHVTR